MIRDGTTPRTEIATLAAARDYKTGSNIKIRRIEERIGAPDRMPPVVRLCSVNDPLR